MKNSKFKSYKYLTSLLAGIIVLLNTVGSVFGFGVDEMAITSISVAVLGVLVILGVVNKDTPETEDTEVNTDNTADKEESGEDKTAE